MTENDYIAEYVKEKRPEIIETPSFYSWKLGRICNDIANRVIESFGKIDWSKVVLSEKEEEQDGRTY